MEVHLAGFNVDATVLAELQSKTGKRADVTPEVLSASYARISRDPRAIGEIRNSARCEVERSRKSNSTIIFRMGHHSVAEHAVFNLDILGVSRLAMEAVEKFRLCSYTEKSQRYITLDKGFVIPDEIKNSKLQEQFIDIIQQQQQAYSLFFQKLKEYVFHKYSDLAADPKKHSLLEGWAKEDARYITALATESQVGQTLNARNAALLLRRFASHPLAEIRKLGEAIYEQISDIAPSIVIFHQANDYDQKTYPELEGLAQNLFTQIPLDSTSQPSCEVELVDWTPDAQLIIVAALLHTTTKRSYSDCLRCARAMSLRELESVFKASWKNMQFYDSLLREFEYVNLTFAIVLSAACFGQLKRHRMSTITAQAYDPSLGVTTPESIKQIGMRDYFQKIIDKTNKVYAAIYQHFPQVAPYVLTNAHRRRILIRLNARELYHISRLREDKHAQWDIAKVSQAMTSLAREKMPLVFALAGGKDSYPRIYQNLYGYPPKVTEAVLPQKRKIR